MLPEDHSLVYKYKDQAARMPKKKHSSMVYAPLENPFNIPASQCLQAQLKLMCSTILRTDLFKEFPEFLIDDLVDLVGKLLGLAG